MPVAAQAVDASGNALGVVDVNVTLDNRHHLVVSPGRPSLLTFDFNLAASNSVDLATTPATVTVTPALVASLDFVEQKELRVRGPLVSVDTAAGTYVADVRPSHVRNHALRPADRHTDANTVFEINGTNYTGGAGSRGARGGGRGTITTGVRHAHESRRASSTRKSCTPAPAFPAPVSIRCSVRSSRAAEMCSRCAVRPWFATATARISPAAVCR